MAENVQVIVSQNTGNPVLDSLVNIASAREMSSSKQLEPIHDILLKLAAKEPGGLRRIQGTSPCAAQEQAEPERH